ncbi:MAG: hypothetical protein Q7T19_01605 [Caulobacter sp.]|nr:hypothetical protein [Caulobacter sp.]
MTLALQVAGYAVALFLLTFVGNVFCRELLRACGLPTTPPAPPPAADGTMPPGPSLKAGRIIGSLERTTIMIGLVVGSWEVLVAVVALKTVARFKDLDERIEAEYFLVGSLASLVWAIIVTGLALWYDYCLGVNVRGAIIAVWPPGVA